MYIIISFGAVELFKSFMEGAKDLKLRYIHLHATGCFKGRPLAPLANHGNFPQSHGVSLRSCQERPN